MVSKQLLLGDFAITSSFGDFLTTEDEFVKKSLRKKTGKVVAKMTKIGENVIQLA